jgi:hypothetical protein
MDSASDSHKTDYGSLLTEAKLAVVGGLRDRPKLLFHYTSAEACFSILHSEPRTWPRLWASSALYTNDASEISYGVELVHDIAPEFVPDGEVKRAFAWDYRRGDYDLLSRLEPSCVACFCTEGDLLSQWRAYGVSGAGYSIGFKAEAIAEAGAKCGFELVPILYDKEKQETAVRQLLARAKDIRSSLDGADEADFWYQAVVSAVELAMSFKDRGFREEQEWRLLATHPVSVRKYRAGRWGIVPYVEIPFEEECVSEIWLGPSLGHRHAQYTFREFLSREYGAFAGGSRIPVLRSVIPYRSS